MTDKELLERAAMAAGLLVQRDRLFVDAEGNFVAIGVRAKWNDRYHRWNALTDSGQALDLAVRIGAGPAGCFQLVVDSAVSKTGVRHTERGGKYDALEDWGLDPLAATRRAIVVAAAGLLR
jgi:hypothetical protein